MAEEGQTPGAGPPPGREAARSPSGGQTPPPGAEPVEGLRAWLADLDRSVGIRTRVGLVLLAIGIGASAAAIYLALGVESESAAESEVAALREELAEARERAEAASAEVQALRTAATAAENLARSVNSRVRALRTEVENLKAASRPAPDRPGTDDDAGGATGGPESEGPRDSDRIPGGADSGADTPSD